MKSREQSLTIEVLKDGRISITMGVEVLPVALEGANTPTTEKVKIANVDQFAKDLVYEMRREEEDGTTIVHEMFDKAIENAINNGSTGCLYPEDAK